MLLVTINYELMYLYVICFGPTRPNCSVYFAMEVVCIVATGITTLPCYMFSFDAIVASSEYDMNFDI